MSLPSPSLSRCRLPLVAVLLLLLSCCLQVLPAHGKDTHFVWQGTIIPAQTMLCPPPGSGGITDRWVLNVRMKETQRLEIKDTDGSLIGWFVKLEDDGSTWSATTEGTFSVPCLRGGIETRVDSADTSGAGPVFTPGWGWIYYSATSDDPLASVLPNGTYALSNTSASTQKYMVSSVRHGCPDSMGQIDVRHSTRPAFLHYKIGGKYVFEPFAMPGGVTPPFMPLQAIQAMAAQSLNIPAAWPNDKQSRQIKDNRMQGSASNAFHNAFSNTLSWNITRVLDIEPVIKKCDEGWRPVEEGSSHGSNEISISASVPDDPEVEGKWRFTLMNITCETGNCLNDGKETTLDMEFVADQDGFDQPRTIRGSVSTGGFSSSSEGSSSSGGSLSADTGGSGGGSSAVSLGKWQSGKDYPADEMVINDNKAYTCIQDHTASAVNEPGAGPKWEDYWKLGSLSSGATTASISEGGSAGADSGASAGSGGGCGDDGGEQEIQGNQTTNEVTVRIKSSDYGAWAKLKAEINVDGVWYQAKSEDGKEYITIPYDKDENRIADNWEEKNGVSGKAAEADEDDQPQDVGSEREPGDGFTNYEEYRGVKVQGQWTELDPMHKDLFIRDETGLGYGKLGDLGLNLHLIDKGEHEDRVINYNRGYATLTTQNGQKGLLLKQEELDGLVGEVRPYVGSPNTVEEVVLNAFPQDMAQEYLEDYQATGGTIESANLQADIAHELAHGLNVLHHGLVPIEVMMKMLVAFPQGVWSGDMNCIMRYDSPQFYYHPGDDEVYDYPAAEEQGGAVRTRFCDSPVGTGVNAAGRQPHPVAGDAGSGRGACRHKVTLKGNHVRGN